ncbi:MAG: hypothetical protein QOG90_195 [Actinomycetota bacterium]|jgi:uncharacterized repeat protein (TIGR03847 family)
MAGESYEFTEADVVTVGTMGSPGRRVFLFQVQAADTTVTLKLEKQQVAALSAALIERLADLPVSNELPTELELRQPVEVAWVVGAMGLGYLDTLDRIVLDAVEAVPVDEEGNPTEPHGRFRVLVTREQGRALAIRATMLVESGRPPCPWCGHPLDPEGHTCPKKNGKHAPER